MLPDEPGIGHHITGEKPGLSQGNLPPAGITSIFLTGMENLNGDPAAADFSGRKDAKNSQSISCWKCESLRTNSCSNRNIINNLTEFGFYDYLDSAVINDSRARKFLDVLKPQIVILIIHVNIPNLASEFFLSSFHKYRIKSGGETFLR